MNTAILILTAICAIGAVITSAPVIAAWWRGRTGTVNSAPPGVAKILWPLSLAMIAFIFSAIGLYRTFQAPRPSQPTPITSENIEANIKKWIDDFGYTERTAPGRELAPYTMFNIEITLRPLHVVHVQRVKDHDAYLVITSDLAFNKEILESLTKLSQQQSYELFLEATRQVATSRIFYWKIDYPFKTLHMEKHTLITGLSEDNLMSDLLEVDNGMLATVTTITLGGEHAKPQVPPHVR